MSNTKTVTLDEPIKRGETDITSITLRKPNSGALRGIAIADLLQLDVTANVKLLPRISEPTLTEAEIAQLDPADLAQLAGAVAAFFLPKSLQTVG